LVNQKQAGFVDPKLIKEVKEGFIRPVLKYQQKAGEVMKAMPEVSSRVISCW
jgi:hypothetical protein